MKKNLLKTLILVVLVTLAKHSFGQAPNLGTAASFYVFTAAGAVNSYGGSEINGDGGTNAGAFNIFPPGTISGQTHVADPTSAQVAADVISAYDALTNTPCGQTIGNVLGNGQVLTPNVYCITGIASLAGNLTLDGQNNPNAVFIIKTSGALSTDASSNIILTNGASATNVFFQVNGAVTVGAGSTFIGTILALAAITIQEGAFLQGRALSRSGAIDLHNNRIVQVSPVSTCNCPK